MRALNNLKTAILLGALMALCMLVGRAVGGPTGLIAGFLIGGIGALISYWFSDTIAIRAARAQEISAAQSPRLFAMVQRLAERANLPMPRVYIIPQGAPNAFATGRSPSRSAVAVTQGMLNTFPEHEIEGVIAHELAHIKHRDMLTSTIAAVMAGAISFIGQMFYFMPGIGGGLGRDSDNDSPLGGIGGMLMLLLAPLAAGIIQMAISRQREYAADSAGAEICGDPLKLRNALARLAHGNARMPMDVNPAFASLYIVKPRGLFAGLENLFSTHPPLEERIERLEAQAAAMR